MEKKFLESVFCDYADARKHNCYTASLSDAQEAVDRMLKRISESGLRYEAEVFIGALEYLAGLCGFIDGVSAVIDVKQGKLTEAVESLRRRTNTKRHGGICAPKPVTQFDIHSGEELAKYPSCKAAERATGINNSVIGQCCKGKLRHAGGFQWRYTE